MIIRKQTKNQKSELISDDVSRSVGELYVQDDWLIGENWEVLSGVRYQNDEDFGALKAILEGSVNGRAKNIAIYATSNRRHLVKESFADRDGDDVHIQDTMQELTSLSARFGLQITFSRPDKNLYSGIVVELAKKYGINMPEDKLIMKAEAHALRAGGRSPRTARQFIEYLAYKQDAEKE